jgi:carboxypeptidase Taq
LRHIGFDFNAGRQDRSSHPFCTTFSISDVRITTRIDPGCFSPGFYGTLHEMGHGLYEQGIDPDLERTPLADGTTLGVHESQSRLWENLVGRSREFVEFHFPRLKQSFPSQFGAASAESFYRAINAVEPSLIRVEADEVTYNLHVMVRFEIERALFENRIQVNHLPETWNDLMEEYLGIRPTSDSDGVLQDIHWSMGAFGYFPTYAIGNLMASQFFAAAKAQLGDLPAQISRGEFEPLVRWLRENIHRHGRRRSANELLLDVTGGALSAAPWLEYIRRKYSELYEVDLDALAD